MLKPVKIIASDKIRTFNDKVRNGLEHALNFMLATDDASKIQIGQFEPFLMPIDTYISAYKKQSILVKIFASKAFEGELYWFFELRTAIALGSLMRMMQPAAIDERLVKGSFDATDQDSFGEVGTSFAAYSTEPSAPSRKKISTFAWISTKKCIQTKPSRSRTS